MTVVIIAMKLYHWSVLGLIIRTRVDRGRRGKYALLAEDGFFNVKSQLRMDFAKYRIGKVVHQDLDAGESETACSNVDAKTDSTVD